MSFFASSGSAHAVSEDHCFLGEVRIACFAMFCYVFAMFCYVFAMFCYVFTMFYYVLLCFCYNLLCVCYVFALKPL